MSFFKVHTVFSLLFRGNILDRNLWTRRKLEQLLLLATFSALELNSLIPKLSKSDSNLCTGQSLVQTNQNTVKIRKSKRTLLFKLSEGLRMIMKMMMDGYMKMMEGFRYKLDDCGWIQVAKCYALLFNLTWSWIFSCSWWASWLSSFFHAQLKEAVLQELEIQLCPMCMSKG